MTRRQIKGTFLGRAISRPSGWYVVTVYYPLMPEDQCSNQQQPLTAAEGALGAPREFEIDKIKDGEINLWWRSPSHRHNNEVIEGYNLTVNNYISFYDPQDERHCYGSSQFTTVIPIRYNTSYEFCLTAYTASSESEPIKLTLVIRKHEVFQKSLRKDTACEDRPLYFVSPFDATTVGKDVIRMDEYDTILPINNNSKYEEMGTGTFEMLPSNNFPDYNTDGVMLKDTACEDRPLYFVSPCDATTVGKDVIRMGEYDTILPINNNSKYEEMGTGTFEMLSSNNFPDYNTDGVMLVLGNKSEKLAFIGSLMNFCLGVQYEDQFRFTPQQHSFHTETVQSHTMIYPLRYQEGLEMRRITICDLQDHTANMVWWKCNNILKTCTLKTLLKTTCDPVRGGVDHVNAIALVLRSDGPPPEAYVLNSLRAMFGPDVVKHVFLIFTDNDTDKARLLSDRRWGSLCSNIKNVEHRYSLNTKLILEKQEPGEQIWYPLMEKCRSLLTKVSSMEPMVVTRK